MAKTAAHPETAPQPSMTDLLDSMAKTTGKTKVKFGDIVKSFQSRGFGPLLLPPAILVMLPTGALPGMSSFCALYTVFIVSQLVVGKDHPWLPPMVRNFSISRPKLDKALKSARPMSKRIDKFSYPRLQFLTTPLAERIVALLCMCLAICMVPLEMLPFASIVPATAIFFFAIGLILKDGIFTLIAVAIVTMLLLGLFNLAHAAGVW